MSLESTPAPPVHNFYLTGDGIVMRMISNEAAQAMLEAADARIKILEEQIRKDEKIITCLIFRGVLESLPDPNDRRSSTAKWDSFLSNAIDKARVDSGHPLRGLLERHRVNFATGAGKDRIMNPFGATLYRQLSTEIHQYLLSRARNNHNQFDFNESNWLLDQSNFLRTIAPNAVGVDDNGNAEVDWVEERRKYYNAVEGGLKIEMHVNTYTELCQEGWCDERLTFFGGQRVHSSVANGRNDRRSLGTRQGIVG
jgi:hypothetical protein